MLSVREQIQLDLIDNLIVAVDYQINSAVATSKDKQYYLVESILRLIQTKYKLYKKDTSCATLGSAHDKLNLVDIWDLVNHFPNHHSLAPNERHIIFDNAAKIAFVRRIVEISKVVSATVASTKTKLETLVLCILGFIEKEYYVYSDNHSIHTNIDNGLTAAWINETTVAGLTLKKK